MMLSVWGGRMHVGRLLHGVCSYRVVLLVWSRCDAADRETTVQTGLGKIELRCA